jgi:hypothetical protein
MMSSRISVLAAFLAMASMPLPAHRAFSAEFDSSRPITLEGVVTRVDWENPHVYFYIDVKDTNGVVNWKCETSGPNKLTRLGWNRDSMKMGNKVVVHGFLAKHASSMVDGRQVTLADGRKILSGPAY